MGFSRPLFIENCNIPWDQAFNDHPQFYIRDWKIDGNKLILYYDQEGGGVSVNFKSRKNWEIFSKKFEVISGAWYGEIGRWKPVEKYIGTIICPGVRRVKVSTIDPKYYSFKVRKAMFSKKLKVIAESDNFGRISFKCDKIIPQQYDVLIQNSDTGKWFPRKETLDKMFLSK